MTSQAGSKYAKSKWAATIARLLAMAEDQTLSDEHRQNCAAKAAAIMTKHGITEAQAHASETSGASVKEVAELWAYGVSGEHHLGPSRADAAELIARAMGCKVQSQRNPPPHPCVVAIVGVPADLDALRVLLPLVLRQAHLAAATEAGKGNRAPSYLASFITGYGAAVAERISARRCEVINATPGAEIILASRTQAVEKLYADRLAAHTRSRTVDPLNAAGLAAGRAAGQRADLGDTRLGPTGRAALGR